jgi:hypothetical protein
MLYEGQNMSFLASNWKEEKAWSPLYLNGGIMGQRKIQKGRRCYGLNVCYSPPNTHPEYIYRNFISNKIALTVGPLRGD